MSESIWQKNSLVTHIFFDLCLIKYFNPVANFGQQCLRFFFYHLLYLFLLLPNFSNISGVLLAIQGRRDYLILQMVDGTMTFTVDNGRGPITAIFKPEAEFQFCDGNWHEIHGKY